jgi:predicted phosphodiesterase
MKTKKNTNIKQYFAIGDIHGRPFWKRHLEENFDEFFILGDYFDCYRYTWEQARDNYNEIIKAARADKRIKLCLGNHDYHYLTDDPDERYSRYNDAHAQETRSLLEDAFDLMQIVYVRGTTIICHAGLTNTFMHIHELEKPEDVNQSFKKDFKLLAFNGCDPYGGDTTQGPLWVRPEALLSDPIIGYSQIVGHTPMEKISKVSLKRRPGESITFIDTGESPSCLEFTA